MVSVREKRFLFIAIIVFVLCTLSYTFIKLHQIQFHPQIHQPQIENQSRSQWTSLSPSDQLCKIPDPDPFHKSIQRFIRPPKVPKCKERFPPFFNSTLDSDIIPAISLAEFNSQNIQACCYRVIWWKSDYYFTLSDFCHAISLERKTEIQYPHEFIAIYCGSKEVTTPSRSRFVGVHAFVHMKPKVEDRLHLALPPSVNKPNVVVLVIDSVSRANFRRWMPKSHKFLMDEMEAIEMKGYNKMQEYTYPHLVALTTSLTTVEFVSICVNRDSSYNQQNCPFIWKDFARNGYRTAYAEDVYLGNTFNNNYIKKFVSFRKQPVDYYPRAFSHFSDGRYRSGSLYAYMCHGPRLLFETLLDYEKKLAYKMNRENKSYFSIFWETALTHDDMNNAMIADEPLKDALSWLNENRHFENTVFILMSDHGQPFGPMRQTPQGQLEYMLPFVYFVLPKPFKQNYSMAFENLRMNERRLITATDIYYTLKDLANLESLREGSLKQREVELKNLTLTSRPPKGISLFLPIPASRSCSQARIEEKSCSCTHYINVSVKEESVIKAANRVIQYINRKVAKEHNKCAVVYLDEIEMAQRVSHSNSTYHINLRTQPGGAEFEAVVLNATTTMAIGNIIRTNSYENQSLCVSNFDRELKELCYCNN